jgi:hypothetical protein
MERSFMSQLKWFFIVFGLLALMGRLGFADVPDFQDGRPPFADGDCKPPMKNMAAESLRQGGLDLSDLQHVNTMIASSSAAKSNTIPQEKIDAILDHFDSEKERWLKKIAKQSCPKAKTDQDDDSQSGPPGGGGPDGNPGASDSSKDADSIIAKIDKTVGIGTGGPEMTKKGDKPSKKQTPKKDETPKTAPDLATDPEILAKTDEVEDALQDALDDRADECEAKMKKEMKAQGAQGQLARQQMGQQGGQMSQQNMMGLMMGQSGQLGQMPSQMYGQMPGITPGNMSMSQMGGVPANYASLQSAYLSPYYGQSLGQSQGGVYNNQSSSRYYNPYLQSYVGY